MIDGFWNQAKSSSLHSLRPYCAQDKYLFMHFEKCFCPLNSSCVFKCSPLNALQAQDGNRKGRVLFHSLALSISTQHEYQSPNPSHQFHFSLLLFPCLDWQFLPPPPTLTPPTSVSGGDFSARPISSIGPPSIQTTPPPTPMPSPPLALLFHTLPRPSRASSHTWLRLAAPHQRLCAFSDS